MEKSIRNPIMVLVLVVAILSIVGLLTSSWTELFEANMPFFALSALFFLASIGVWILSWAYLLRKTSRIGYAPLFKIGFTSVYGSLTPVQLGTEALRSIQLKQYFNVSYSESVSASMVVKGLKFLVLLVVAIGGILLFSSKLTMDPVVMFGFLSGFAVVLLAVLLFLLPLNRNLGNSISGFFFALSRKIRPFEALGKFFKSYSLYLEKTTFSALVITFFLAVVSFALEFLALYFSFVSVGLFLGITAIAILMVLISILERTPLLPRGIGLVEIVSFQFLSIAGTGNAGQIGAAIILFDIARLVIPGISSIVSAGIFSKGIAGKGGPTLKIARQAGRWPAKK